MMLDQNRPKCVHGVVGVVKKDNRYLIIQRSQHVKAPGMWCFAGGTIEPGESPDEAIVREMREEVGIEVRPERELWSWLKEDGSLHLRWWEVTHCGGEITPNPLEVETVQWMTAEEIRTQEGMAPNNLAFLDFIGE